MIDLDRTMFFKAKFEVEASRGEDALWSVVMSVRDWSRFKFARGEGPQTRANSKFMREREDEYQGRELFIEPHICSSVGDPNSPQFIRIYFNWDEETGRLVIGDTRHLTNCTTRRL